MVDIAGLLRNFALTNIIGFVNSVGWFGCSLDAFLGFENDWTIHSFNALIDTFFRYSNHLHFIYISLSFSLKLYSSDFPESLSYL